MIENQQLKVFNIKKRNTGIYLVDLSFFIRDKSSVKGCEFN